MRERDLVDIAEAARLTGLARSTIYKLVQQRRPRSFKVLHARRFERADLLALVTEEADLPGNFRTT
jgi:excisionase family DNA binding protein